MKRWKLAAAAAGFVAACVAVPAQGAEWCIHDPQLSIPTSQGASVTVYVTEGVMGAQHQAQLASAKISYTTYAVSKRSLIVAVHDYIPSDSSGSFRTELIVSSKPSGSGVVYGSAYGTSGTTMTVWFWLNRESAGG
ncbi:MAG: hypothetical protein ACHQ0J_09635 [Candidatus Dormibacterales bacterium]